MSTKDTFNRNYLTDNNEKDAFSDVESSDNLKAVRNKQKTFVPQINYADPASFAKYGSALLYYNSALERVADYYPYDGSDAEINDFYNRSLDIEKYIFNSKYPRTNGYVTIAASSWGVLDGSKTHDGYGKPTTPGLEYITFKGGPNSISQTADSNKLIPDPTNNKFQYSNVYDEDLYTNAGLTSDYGKGTRTSNLRSNFDDGVTVEFWTKTGSLDTSLTEKQVILDIWNNELSSSAAYGRITIELDGTAAGSPWIVTVRSGSTDGFSQVVGTAPSITTLGDWKHYAFAMYNTGSDFAIKLYVDGDLDATETVSATNISELNPSNMMGRLGALMTAPHGAADVTEVASYVGAGKLSGSIDEFRFWKEARTAKDIGRNWFTQIRGGANTDISNTTLGLYYKFNEGITTDASLDSVVLDYGGRICNGAWTGYGSNSRNTGSAIVSAAAAATEYLDPIIYTTHPDVVSLKTELSKIGMHHDSQNNSMFLKYVPAWVLEEAEDLGNSDLEKLTHVIGAYFDKLYLQIAAVPGFRHPTYTSSSHESLPFAQHLPQSLGLYTPEIFIDSNILEKIANRTDTKLFQDDLNDTKNLIYQNIYNNLAHILKSKGTERSVRNLLRCFNIDDNLIYLRTYSNNQTYELQNNLKQTQKKRKILNLNKSTSTTAVVYQAADPTYADSRGYISGSGDLAYEDEYGFTAEVGIEFPKFVKLLDTFARGEIETVSLFGMHSASTDDPTDTTIYGSDAANFQVQAVRDAKYSKNVYFKLSSSIDPFPIPEITSSLFYGVYDDDAWNLSVALRPSKYPYVNVLSGSDDYTYDVVFRGYNNKLGTINNKFELSASVSKETGQNFLRSSKRMYIGATNENITGSTNLFKSDVLYNNAKYWTKYVDSYTLKQHAVDKENFGISGSYRNIDAIATPTNNQSSLNLNTLALNWYFQNSGPADSAGEFYVTDLSSGSAFIRDNFGWAGQLGGYIHSGKGTGFAANDPDATINKIVNEFKFMDPEQVRSSDMVKVLTNDDEIFGTYDEIPNYVYTIEKSLYAAVSEEILDFFAGALDFNNLIGDPVNRYRQEYKSMNHLRRIFFERFNNISTVEKYLEYFKWFDDSLATIISQLVPASADFVNDTYNTVESHVLERNKYQSQFPTIEFKQKDPETSIRGIVETKLKYLPDLFGGLEASPRPTNLHKNFWKKRALPGPAGTADFEITSSNALLDIDRQRLKEQSWSRPEYSASMPVLTQKNGTKYSLNRLLETQKAGLVDLDGFSVNRTIKGGVNFEHDKDVHYTQTSLYPAGPVEHEPGGTFVPQNVLFAKTIDLSPIDPLGQWDEDGNIGKKRKRHLKVVQGRDYDGGLGYTANKNSFAFPFNVMSASIVGGADDFIRKYTEDNLTITNLHNDVYGDELEVPMQGPFTNYAVGGHQSRHIRINIGNDNYTNRPEAWKILLGKCTGISGAIGMASADYPWPEANDVGETPYPMTASQKAVYFRDHIAKRPVNIRNIQMRTGSTILGNYEHNYEVVHTFGASENPRNFIETQPTLPTVIFQNSANSSTQTRTFLDTRRTSEGHFEFVPEYDIGYISGTTNKTVITTRFDGGAGLLSNGNAYRDFRSNEFSVYNSPKYRHISVTKPSQTPAGMVSEVTGAGTPGIRVFDIHGRDFGLTAHSARHTARFGRDSTLVTTPGTSYDEAPGFHKIHRNNVCGIKATACTLETILTGTQLVNTEALYFGDQTSRGMCLTNADQSSATTFLTSSRINGFSYSGWVRFAPTSEDVNAEHAGELFSIGRNAADDEPFINIYKDRTPDGKFYALHLKMATRNTDWHTGPTRMAHLYGVTSSLDDGNWHHVVVSVPRGNIAFETSPAIAMYFDGAPLTMVTQSGLYTYYDQTRAPNYSFRTKVAATGESVLCLGGRSSDVDAGFGATPLPFTGAMDQVSLWTRDLAEAEVTTLYNAGVPCDITSSGIPLGDLYSWYKLFMDNENTDAIKYTNPGFFSSGSNSIFNWDADIPRNLFPVSHNVSNLNTLFETGYPSPLAGCTPTTLLIESCSYSPVSIYDNFFVQHQIPRSTKQYAWITASLQSDNGICGFVRPDFTRRVSSSAGIMYVDAYDFVSASDYGSYYAAGERGFGGAYADVVAAGRVDSFIPQVSDLNLNIYESLTSSTNTLGLGNSTLYDYINKSDGLISAAPISLSPSAFNNLMIKRNGPYGYPTWKRLRQQNHPILRDERRNNRLTAFTTGSTLSSYDLRPVSMVGRPSYVNINFTNTFSASIGGVIEIAQNATLKTSYGNEYVLFNDKKLNEFVDINFDNQVTPFEQLVAMKERKNIELNWVLYKENLFPSIRNEFASSSTTRVGYDNKFWRDNQTNRVSAGYGVPNSVGVEWGDNALVGGSPRFITQSIWCLDAPLDFETRTGPATILPGSDLTNLIRSNSAGELQNTYSSYHFHSSSQPHVERDWFSVRNSALYSRKHMLSSPLSVNSPTGIKMVLSPIPDGGYGFNALDVDPLASGINTVATGSGEAKWEAATQAGYLTTSNGITGFVSAPSAPFYNDYDEFRQDIKTIAKGYSVVPEFRISEQIENYSKFGIMGAENFDTFTIPGTSISSSQENFYKDYSNSDFMENFLDVRQMCGLTAKEIKLTCKAAIKFNPYKGFYPAQRTIELVSQFSKSYADGITVFNQEASYDSATLGLDMTSYAYVKPVFQPLFAPGILYNSIKSGIAVDYPVVTDRRRVEFKHVTGSVHSGRQAENYLVGSRVDPNLRHLDQYRTGSFWDKRLPFETIINPRKTMAGLGLAYLEPHPSQSFNNNVDFSASLGGSPEDNIYTLMASNFFAEVGKFFLDKGGYSRLETSGPRAATKDIVFPSGQIYGARLKIRNSYTGSRGYAFESGSTGDNTFFSPHGARALNITSSAAVPAYEDYDASNLALSGSYEIPQDPAKNPNFKQNFTMYSRTTAFGPPCIGRPYSGSLTAGTAVALGPAIEAFALSASNYGHMDSLNGFNWSFTPPYYHGESWVDFIFAPQPQTAYNLEKILKETKTVTRRFDPGESFGKSTSDAYGLASQGANTLIIDIPVDSGVPQGPAVAAFQPYSGININSNAMQIDAAINLFGIENIPKKRFDAFGNLIHDENDIAGQKWVIQTKFETPMMNFSDTGIHPISNANGTLTMPANFGSESVPRGMWHQFGVIPEDTTKGIFLEIGDIPETWLKNHYEVIGSSSVYNNFTGSNGHRMHTEYKSFADLMGFNAENSSVRLGEVSEKQVIKEAVVAVPYIVEGVPYGDPTTGTPIGVQARKKFINIPKYRYDSALGNRVNSADGDSLDSAGISIRRQIDKMEQYVLPPQFDFLNNTTVDPIVMYLFEFKYELDRDDLSYIWQNLAPRNYKKMTLEESSVAHELINTELLTERNLLESSNLRWMVFKVKQRSQAMYDDVVVRQVGQPLHPMTMQLDPALDDSTLDDSTQNYKVRYNWPYDFVSIVESIKLDADVLFKDREPVDTIMVPGTPPAGLVNSILDKRQRRTLNPDPGGIQANDGDDPHARFVIDRDKN